jgi:polyisoprenoid-binding protein YceI
MTTLKERGHMTRRAVALAAVLAASPAMGAETFVIDKGHSEVGFQIRHMMTKVRGRFTDFEGHIEADRAKPQASSVELTIQAASIDTANANRDKDLRGADFFDVEKYPAITFKSTRMTPKGKDSYDVTGTLTMRGVSKEITLPVTLLGIMKNQRGVDSAGFETAVTLNRKDFGIVWNRALDAGGVLLGDEVYVSINLETRKEAPPSPPAQ